MTLLQQIKVFCNPPHFGHCPECGKEGVNRNVGRDHWFACDEHKLRWYVGSNLFSYWRDQTREQWDRNAELLKSYREVESYHPPLWCYDLERLRWRIRAIFGGCPFGRCTTKLADAGSASDREP